MTDVFLPLSVDIASISFRYIDSTGVSRNPLTGAVRTASRGGDRVGASVTFTPAGGSSTTGAAKRRKLKSSLWGLKGKQGRLVFTDPSYTPAGSFPTSELLTNNDFSNGTTGWSNSAATLSVSGSVMRATFTGSGTECDVYNSAGLSVTQYAPYALRTFCDPGPWLSGLLMGPVFGTGSTQYDAYSTTLRGLRTASGVTLATTTGNVFAQYAQTAGMQAGAYYDIHWSSYARCALIDNGPNALTYSDQIDNAAWTKGGVTVSANSASQTDPFGTTTSEKINEDTSTGQHYIVQTGPSVSSAADYCGFIDARQDNLDRDIQLTVGTTGSGNFGVATFDLSAGTIGVAASAAGTATNPRAFIESRGNGWYRCFVVVRLPTAATTASLQVNMVASGTSSYTGTTGTVMLIRGGVAQSSVPTRGALTTSAATTGTAQTGGGIYLKGLPASTSGLLLEDDWVEIITSLGSQLCKVMASLDSDAAGLGYLQIAPPIRGTVADNAAVIINKPMGRFLAGDLIDLLTEPGIVTTASVDLEESPF